MHEEDGVEVEELIEVVAEVLTLILMAKINININNNLIMKMRGLIITPKKINSQVGLQTIEEIIEEEEVNHSVEILKVISMQEGLMAEVVLEEEGLVEKVTRIIRITRTRTINRLIMINRMLMIIAKNGSLATVIKDKIKDTNIQIIFTMNLAKTSKEEVIITTM